MLDQRAPTTLVRAITEPTDRSMPPLTMIIVIPSAPIADDDRLGEDDLEIVVREKGGRVSGAGARKPDHEDEPEEGTALGKRIAWKDGFMGEPAAQPPPVATRMISASVHSRAGGRRPARRGT